MVHCNSTTVVMMTRAMQRLGDPGSYADNRLVLVESFLISSYQAIKTINPKDLNQF